MLAAELAVAAVLLIAPSGAAPVPPAMSAPGPAPAVSPTTTLVTADGRTVRLITPADGPTAPVLRRVAALMPAAVASVQRFWGQDWPREIPVIATATDAQFRAQAGPAAGRPGDIAAVAVADRVDPARREATGQRIVLAPGAGRMSESALRIVMTHELFHFAARRDTAADAPAWLTEAVADYVARRGEPIPPGRPLPAALPSDAEFARSGPDLSASYDRAWLFARFVADRYGEPTLRRLYAATCGTGHTDVTAALSGVLGSTPGELLDRWRGWLTG
ncbi:hypothetical protein [Mycolicibacterium palauense]|uniref:hypothetical protein n=1 Tax=Mycolicibacterium palauense TaxID=2034511 RepID=UPI001FE40B75|nr:hypothetical protein [Mycolicibacterium palauense]